MRWMELLNFLFPPTLSTQTFWAIDQSFGKSIKQKKGRRGEGGDNNLLMLLSRKFSQHMNIKEFVLYFSNIPIVLKYVLIFLYF